MPTEPESKKTSVAVEIPDTLWDPERGEEGSLINWLVEDGSRVEAGDEIAEIMVEKVTVVVEAPAGGALRINTPADAAVRLGEVIADIRP